MVIDYDIEEIVDKNCLEEVKKRQGYEYSRAGNIEERAEILEKFMQSKNDKYGHLGFISSSGGVRDVFSIRYGPDFQNRRIVKVNKLDFGENARHAIEGGYDCLNELTMTHYIQDVRIRRTLDYYSHEETKDFGIPGNLVVEEMFGNGQNLEDYVLKNGPLNVDQVKDVFMPLIEVVCAANLGDNLIRKMNGGIYHRDIKPSNILIKEFKTWGIDRLEMSVGDWANATWKWNETEKFYPTRGGPGYSDILLFSDITGVSGSYNDSSDPFGIISTLGFAIFGKPLFYVDLKESKITSQLTGEVVTDDLGKIVPLKYSIELGKTFDLLPEEFKPLYPLFNNGLSLDIGQRYDARSLLSEFNDFYLGRHEYQMKERRKVSWLREKMGYYGGLWAFYRGKDIVIKEKIVQGKRKFLIEVKRVTKDSFGDSNYVDEYVTFNDGSIVLWDHERKKSPLTFEDLTNASSFFKKIKDNDNTPIEPPDRSFEVRDYKDAFSFLINQRIDRSRTLIGTGRNLAGGLVYEVDNIGEVHFFSDNRIGLIKRGEENLDRSKKMRKNFGLVSIITGLNFVGLPYDNYEFGQINIEYEDPKKLQEFDCCDGWRDPMLLEIFNKLDNEAKYLAVTDLAVFEDESGVNNLFRDFSGYYRVYSLDSYLKELDSLLIPPKHIDPAIKIYPDLSIERLITESDKL